MKKRYYFIYLILLKTTLALETGHYYYNGIIDNNCNVKKEFFVCNSKGTMILPEDYSDIMLIKKSSKEIIIFITDFYNSKSIKISLFKNKETQFSNIIYTDKNQFFVELLKEERNLVLIVKTNDSKIDTTKKYIFRNKLSKPQIEIIENLEYNKLYFLDDINLLGL